MAAPSTLTSTDLSQSVHGGEPTSRSSAAKTTFRIGTRASALALAQTEILISLLGRTHPGYEFAVQARRTAGDRDQGRALHAFDAKALWTEELEAELVAGATDLVAHSLKDLPTQLPAGCGLGAACVRTERRDCVVVSRAGRARGWRGLADLPPGSVVGTSSVRRIAQCRSLFPHLAIQDVRGNVGTRLAKLDHPAERYAALILAATGLQRTGEGERVSSFLSWTEGGWLGAVGQGALGVEVRSGDKDVEPLCEALMRDGEGDRPGEGKRVWLEALAERMLLRTLEGGCSVPLGVETEWTGQDEMAMRAMVMSVDGTKEVRGFRTFRIRSREEAEEAGLDMARDMVEKGAGEILEGITLNRKIIQESGGA